MMSEDEEIFNHLDAQYMFKRGDRVKDKQWKVLGYVTIAGKGYGHVFVQFDGQPYSVKYTLGKAKQLLSVVDHV